MLEQSGGKSAVVARGKGVFSTPGRSDGQDPVRRVAELLKKVPPIRHGVRLARFLARHARAWVRSGLNLHDPAKLRALRDIHRGRRGWVIGNGPSLTQLDLSLLKGEITLASNCFFLLFDKLDWLPKYYFVEDDLVAEDNAEIINNLHGMVKVFPRDRKDVLLPDEDTVYVDFMPGEYLGFPRFSSHCDRIVYSGGTVTYTMLQLAYWVGCNPIYLIGTDMDYRVPDYMEGATIVSREPDVNHFCAEYFGPGKRWHDPRVDTMQKALGYACRFLSGKGVSAYNATRGGKLRDWPRVVYEDVFKRNGPVE